MPSPLRRRSVCNRGCRPHSGGVPPYKVRRAILNSPTGNGAPRVVRNLPTSWAPPYNKYGEDGIRTHVPVKANGFQDRLVMTTSIPLHALRKSDARPLEFDFVEQEPRGAGRVFPLIDVRTPSASQPPNVNPWAPPTNKIRNKYSSKTAQSCQSFFPGRKSCRLPRVSALPTPRTMPCGQKIIMTIATAPSIMLDQPG